jgi:monoamine oxidase
MPHVAVVGAGIAGLTAARRLSAHGVDVVVFEGSERVGGRTLSEPISESEQIEMGGQWVGPTQERVLALLDELGLETFPTRTQGHNLIEVRGALRRYRGTIPKLPAPVLLDLAIARFRLGRAMRKVDPGAPWQAARSEELDRLTLADWIGRNVRSRLARDLISLSCKTVWGAEPHELSLLWALSYMAAGGGFEKLLDVEGGAQQDRVVGGSALICERMAEELGDRVKVREAVSRIDWSEEGLGLEVSSGVAEARTAVIAVPPALLAHIEFSPGLPPSHAALAAAWRGGDLIKVSAVYDEPFWRRAGASGEAVSLKGPVTIAFDNSPPSGTPGVLVGFIGGRDAGPYRALAAGRRRAVALSSLARLFGEEAHDALAFLERDWRDEPWAAGGPVSNLGPGVLARHGRALADGAGPLRFAASEYADTWRGYMDGAVRSGEAAADSIMASLR